MEFEQPKGIYQQIADQISDRIVLGEWQAGERIPSIRELAVSMGVNPNTVTRSYQSLLDDGVIENRRGIGYFVAEDATVRIVSQRKQAFLREELPRLFHTMRLLGIDSEEIASHLAALEKEHQS
ncbi:MAG: GntR family transcriptional regulator [Gammaproteobacteria bacterium]|nr:GntR family transcriptional regulator [Gammaproteobacteria bacterium]